jgi:hypothetical protein
MSEARAIFNKLGTAFDALDAIEGVAKDALGANKTVTVAFEALHVISGMIAVLKAGFKGKLTVEEVQEEIKQLHLKTTANDAAADQALHDKFDKT